MADDSDMSTEMGDVSTADVVRTDEGGLRVGFVEMLKQCSNGRLLRPQSPDNGHTLYISELH